MFCESGIPPLGVVNFHVHSQNRKKKISFYDPTGKELLKFNLLVAFIYAKVSPKINSRDLGKIKGKK